MIEKVLKNLNFSEKETIVYLSLVKNDQASAGQISKNTGINRTTIYDILESLKKRGLVSQIQKKSKIYFYALSPEKLLNYLELEKKEFEKKNEIQRENIEKIIPDLISMQNFSSINKPRVKFFEGVKGIRDAYEDTLTADGVILAYANVEEVHKSMPTFFPEYYKRRVAAKIHIKAIFPQNTVSKIRKNSDKVEMRTSKFLPKKNMTFSPEVNIYNNKILYVSWKEKIAVLMESKELSDFHKLNFGLVWDSLD